jgi:phosphoribosylaminoimidazole carboxylase (NCAIR synthetase)
MQFRKPLTATAVALGMTFGGVAVAQDAAPEAEMPEAQTEAPMAAPGADSAQFSQEQLESFVAAALEVSGIQQEAASQLMATEDQAEQDTVLQEANQQMIEAIESEPGISVPEYIAIAEAAETDQALRSQLEQMIVSAQMDQPQE